MQSKLNQGQVQQIFSKSVKIQYFNFSLFTNSRIQLVESILKLQSKKELPEVSIMFLELCFSLMLSFFKRKTQNEKKEKKLSQFGRAAITFFKLLFRFVGGELNICYNAVDRHVENGRGDQIAIIYDSPVTNTKEKITYKELLEQVCFRITSLMGRGNEYCTADRYQRGRNDLPHQFTPFAVLKALLLLPNYTASNRF